MLLWIRQALFPIFSIPSNHAIRSPASHIARCCFSLLHPILISLICEFECAVILRCMCFERHTNGYLTLWKFEIMQISGHYIRCTFHTHLNTQRHSDVLSSYDTSIVCRFYRLFCFTRFSHNSQYYRCFLGIRQQLSASFSLFLNSLIIKSLHHLE